MKPTSKQGIDVFIGTSIFIMFVLMSFKLDILRVPLMTAHILSLFVFRRSSKRIDIIILLFLLLIIYSICQAFILEYDFLTMAQAVVMIFFNIGFYIYARNASNYYDDFNLGRISRNIFWIYPLLFVTVNNDWQGRLGGLLSNPNVTTHTGVILFPLLLLGYTRRKSKIAFILLIILTLLTESRSGLMALLVGICVYKLIMVLKGKIGFLGGLILSLLVILVSYTAIDIATFLYSNLFPNLTYRDSHLLYEGYNGRDILAELALKRFRESPYLGVGFSGAKFTLDDTVLGTHNGYLEMLLKVGIIGFSIFVIILLVILNKIVKSKFIREKAAAFMSLAIILSLSSNSSLFFVFNYYFYYFLVIYFISQRNSAN